MALGKRRSNPEVDTMRRAVLRCLPFVVVLAGVGGGVARAQYPAGRAPFNPYSRPPYSPYLNLLRPGNQAVNYYGLVRPQQDFRSDFRQLQESLYAQPANLVGAGAADVVTTGNRGEFLNYQRYFLNNRNAGPGIAAAGATRASLTGPTAGAGGGRGLAAPAAGAAGAVRR
jgi:hypothetical protein